MFFSFSNQCLNKMRQTLCSSLKCHKRLSKTICKNAAVLTKTWSQWGNTSQLLLTHNREDESVGEMLKQREFHYISAELQETSSLRETDENVNAN